MNDMSAVIVPKSDQINADDLIAGPMTITITDVQIRGGQEQPVSIYFADSEKAFRPCKSMSRVLVQAWGPDANAYVGRSLTLYRDPKVKWGGLEVGGIRISHMTHIKGQLKVVLAESRSVRKPTVIEPLVTQDKPATDTAQIWADGYIASIRAVETLADLETVAEAKAMKLASLEAKRPELHQQCVDVLQSRREFLAPEGRATEDMGEANSGFNPADFED